jgi:hypothetical protein
MIQLTPQMRILVAVEPVDFRKGIEPRFRRHADLVQPASMDGDPWSLIVFWPPRPLGRALRGLHETSVRSALLLKERDAT